jgi:outer membrane protein assembly factor BamE (lipoprotein component of BamABCDE complex)
MKKLLLLSAAVLTLAACAPTRNTNGMYLDAADVTKLQAGTSTRADVLQTLGTPSTTAVFDENTWYYVGQKTEKKAFFDAKVTDKKVYEVKFDDTGTLTSVQMVEGDAIDVPIVRRKTPTSGHDLTAAQQLLGNLGRFNKQKTNKVPGTI